jgi:hypothetical protein
MRVVDGPDGSMLESTLASVCIVAQLLLVLLVLVLSIATEGAPKRKYKARKPMSRDVPRVLVETPLCSANRSFRGGHAGVYG